MDALFTGKWQSNYHQINLIFNENVWRLVNDGHDHQKGSLFGLFCENDGASFSMDFALKDAKLNYNYAFAEAEFFARMFNLDNHCQRLTTFSISISGHLFQADQYHFNNRKYSEQIVTRAMHINPNFVIAMGMAWPVKMQREQQLPIKFNHLIHHLSLPSTIPEASS